MTNELKGDKIYIKTLEVALVEFLTHTFDNASMRNIAKNAGITTGALYNRFSGKDDIFKELVSPVTDSFELILKRVSMSNKTQIQSSSMWLSSMPMEIVCRITSYIFENHNIFMLLINCSKGSSYENYIDKLISFQEDRIYNNVQHMLKENNSPIVLTKEDIHTLVSSQFYAMFEVIRHETSYEDACDRIYKIFKFYGFGWNGIFAQKG